MKILISFNSKIDRFFCVNGSFSFSKLYLNENLNISLIYKVKKGFALTHFYGYRNCPNVLFMYISLLNKKNK